MPKPVQEDYRTKGLRKQLVAVLERKGIADPEVLAAIGAIPRHLFIDDTAFLQHAYEDIAFPIACGQTISQPYTVARQTELLGPVKGRKVLEVGTGSGYQTAVLTTMGAKVFSIERHKPLFVRTKQRLEEMGYRANLYYGDGYAGLPMHAPFDAILVTCGAPYVPPALQAQLKPGGVLVIPVGPGDVQRMRRLVLLPDGTVSDTAHGDFRFVPMLGEKADNS